AMRKNESKPTKPELADRGKKMRESKKDIERRIKAKMPKRELTDPERAAIGEYLDHKKQNPAPSSLRAPAGTRAASTMELCGPIGRALLMKAVGSMDHDFFEGIFNQLGNAAMRDQKIDYGRLNFMLSVIKGIKPKNQGTSKNVLLMRDREQAQVES